MNFTVLRVFQNVRMIKELQGLRVKVTRPPYPRKCRVARIIKESAKQLCFTMEDGSRNSVSGYFQAKYCPLSYPNQR